MTTEKSFRHYFDKDNPLVQKVIRVARLFNQRPSEIIDPHHRFGSIFALEFDAFCASIAMEMISEEKLI